MAFISIHSTTYACLNCVQISNRYVRDKLSFEYGSAELESIYRTASVCNYSLYDRYGWARLD